MGGRRTRPLYDTVCLGIDQSYERCGMSVAADGKLLSVSSLDLSRYKTKTEKRRAVGRAVAKQAARIAARGADPICVVERIRTFSKNFISAPYMIAMGGMNAVIVDTCSDYSIPVFSVNTKVWKSHVIGTSLPQENEYGVPPEKWPTVKWCIDMGFRSSIMLPVTGRKVKGTFIAKDGNRYMYDNDAADSAGIALFPFVKDLDLELLKVET